MTGNKFAILIAKTRSTTFERWVTMKVALGVHLSFAHWGCTLGMYLGGAGVGILDVTLAVRPSCGKEKLHGQPNQQASPWSTGWHHGHPNQPASYQSPSSSHWHKCGCRCQPMTAACHLWHPLRVLCKHSNDIYNTCNVMYEHISYIVYICTYTNILYIQYVYTILFARSPSADAW